MDCLPHLECGAFRRLFFLAAALVREREKSGSKAAHSRWQRCIIAALSLFISMNRSSKARSFGDFQNRLHRWRYRLCWAGRI